MQPYPEVESASGKLVSTAVQGLLGVLTVDICIRICRRLFEVANQVRMQLNFCRSSSNYRGIFATNGNRARNYDAHPIDEKFLYMQVPARDGVLNSDIVSLVMVENWFEELKRLRPVDPNLM